jgi:hypothetical protein
MTRAKTAENPTLKGGKYRATHKASVTAILGSDTRRVSSRGSRFFNKDHWTGRALLHHMCEWAKTHGDLVPTREIVEEWLTKSRYQSFYGDPEIVIASTPDQLKVRVASALIGGAYHEAWHTLYSARREISLDEACEIILPRWAKVADWSKYYRLLMEWSNLIEDIRIERLGCAEFPGTRNKMCDLADFVIDLESDGKESAKAHGIDVASGSALNTVCCTFREVGLGYSTDKIRKAMQSYITENPAAVALVLQGPLSGFLRESIALTREDDLGCIRLAMDVIETLAKLGGHSEDNDEKEDDNGGGKGEKFACSNCGAPGNKVRVTPMIDTYGVRSEDKALMTCTVCGHQDEVEITQNQDSGESTGSGDGPIFEGFEDQDSDSDSDSGEDKEGDDSGDQTGQGESGDQDGEESDEKGKGSGSDPDGSDPEGTEKGDSEKGDSEGSDDKSDQKPEGGDDSPVGGGHHDGGTEHKGNDFSDLANDILQEAEAGNGLKDNNSALEEAFNEQDEKEVQQEGGVNKGEAPYRPFDTSLDETAIVGPSHRGKDYDKKQAEDLLRQTKNESSYLRARLRTIVRALEMTNTVHGTRRGKGLSERMLVDTKVTLMSNRVPMRAYYQIDDQIDTSFAASVVIDESSSMSDKLRDATSTLVAITEPLDALGCAVQVSGFRNGKYSHYDHHETRGTGKTYHRSEGIRHDIFKTFDERFSSVRHRFACTRAEGSTPMADGIQFGLDALNNRPEAHRVLFVITDGCPDGGHGPVIQRQIRLANEAGINVIGVGLGYGSSYVKDLFPDHVYTDRLDEMPKALVAKLNEILDLRAAKRGRRMKKTA